MVKFLNALKPDVALEPVNCGGCPASFTCLADSSDNPGNGYRFNCCGAVGVDVPDPQAPDDDTRTMLAVLDCQRNSFYQNRTAAKVKACPLCTGEIIEAALRGHADDHYYVPTVHAKKPLADRLKLWHRVLKLYPRPERAP